MKVHIVCIVGIFLCVLWATPTLSYSAGAPPEVCSDMTPKHPAEPQKSKMPYSVSVSKTEVKAGDVVEATIKGSEGFKGFVLQARANGTPVGKFLVNDADKYVKTVDCGSGKQNSVTHKNSEVKNNLAIKWQAPQNFKGQVQFYVTVALDGGTYWVRQPTKKVQIK